MELTVTRGEAGQLIDDAIDLTSRLPRTLAGMAGGLIDAARAGWIAIPVPDGPTSQGNLAPRCRTHHRAKQRPETGESSSSHRASPAGSCRLAAPM
jgi:hypothetical protein